MGMFEKLRDKVIEKVSPLKTLRGYATGEKSTQRRRKAMEEAGVGDPKPKTPKKKPSSPVVNTLKNSKRMKRSGKLLS